MGIIKQIDKKLSEALKVEYVSKYARVILFSFLLILLLPIVLTKFPFPLFDFTETGQIGDTIGGITAPFIGIIAGCLTFLAFHEQYRANKESSDDLKKERFESKFYGFLTLLNNLEINTSIPEVGNYKQAFHFMFYEYKAIAVLVYRKLKCPNLEDQITYKNSEDKQVTTTIRKYILDQAFGIYINGVSTSSTSRLGEYLTGKEDLNDYFLWLQKYFDDPGHPNVPYLDDYVTIKIKLFDGHRLRLISFFRLICKILELIYNYEGQDEEKELYLSTLLSILSEHQIALLKLIYVYDNKEHDRFVLNHKDEIRSFFNDKYDENNPKVCINKYIYSKIMDCSEDQFVNFEKGNKVGVLDQIEQKE